MNPPRPKTLSSLYSKRPAPARDQPGTLKPARPGLPGSNPATNASFFDELLTAPMDQFKPAPPPASRPLEATDRQSAAPVQRETRPADGEHKVVDVGRGGEIVETGDGAVGWSAPGRELDVRSSPASFPSFPYPSPYPSQAGLMRAAFALCAQGKIGLLESPTGTGTVDAKPCPSNCVCLRM